MLREESVGTVDCLSGAQDDVAAALAGPAQGREAVHERRVPCAATRPDLRSRPSNGRGLPLPALERALSLSADMGSTSAMILPG